MFLALIPRGNDNQYQYQFRIEYWAGYPDTPPRMVSPAVVIEVDEKELTSWVSIAKVLKVHYCREDLACEKLASVRYLLLHRSGGKRISRFWIYSFKKKRLVNLPSLRRILGIEDVIYAKASSIDSTFTPWACPRMYDIYVIGYGKYAIVVRESLILQWSETFERTVKLFDDIVIEKGITDPEARNVLHLS